MRHLDEAIAAVFLDTVQPASLETTLAAFAAMERERRDLDQHWQVRLDRARYEAQRAQRQYDAVEPENRSVARSLEARWNAALEALDKLQAEYALMQQTELLPLSDEDQQDVRRLAADLPALWHAETTPMVDRKRLLRLVVTEVTLTVDPTRRQANFAVLWCGGAVTHHTADCPSAGLRNRTEPRVLDRMRDLASRWPDHQVAAHLNAEHLPTRTGKEWTYARVHSMRKQHGIPTACPLTTADPVARADGLVPIKVAAQRLQVSTSLLNLWVQHGVLAHDQRTPASKVWVRLTEDDVARLTGTSPHAAGLPTFRKVLHQTGLSQGELWRQVRDGHYRAYRVHQGETWQWRLLALSTNPDASAPTIRRDRQGRTPYEYLSAG